MKYLNSHYYQNPKLNVNDALGNNVIINTQYPWLIVRGDLTERGVVRKRPCRGPVS